MKTKLWTKNFIMITAINLLIFFGFQVMLVTLPLYTKTLGAGDSYIGWISGVITISAVFVRLFAGKLLDRINRKLILAFGIVITAAATFTYGWVTALALILMIRFIHGIGWGIATTATNTMAADIIPHERMGEGMGFFGLSSSIAMSFAPAVALIFFNSVAFQEIAAYSAIMISLSLLLLLVFPYRLKREERVVRKETWYEKNAIIPSAIMFFVTASYGAVLSFIAIYGEQRGIENVGIFFTALSVAVLIVRPLAGKLFDLYGHRMIVIVSLILLFTSLWILSIADTITLFIVSAVLYGAGFGSIQSSLQTAAVISTVPSRRGAATATFYIGFDVGIGLGSVIGGMISAGLGYDRMYQIYSLSLIAVFIIFTFFLENKKAV